MAETNNTTDFLSPETLVKIDNYQLLASTVVDGFMSGLHRSMYHGLGSEFLQYRAYSPGDDPKHVDWKAYSRSNKLQTKVFQEETNMNCSVILDTSSSMGYKGDRSPCTKLQYGCMLAASMLYLASKQGDNLGLFCYNSSLNEALPPSNRQGRLSEALHALHRVKAEGTSGHVHFLPYVSEAIGKRGLVIIISDFLEQENIAELLKTNGFTRHECLAFQLLDPDELDLPFDGVNRFIDSETGGTIVSAAGSVRENYQKSMNHFIETLRHNLTDIGTLYHNVRTSDSLGEMLAAYLHHRGAVYL